MIIVKGFLVCLLLSSNVAIAEDSLSSALASLNQIVTDQSGKQGKFYNDFIKNNTVAINFIFTRCISSCPLSSAVFQKIQALTSDKPIQLISITLDPTVDTTEQLQVYAEKFQAGANWHFVTGEQTVISSLLKVLGVFTADKSAHTNMVIVGNAAKQHWLRLYGLPDANDINNALINVR